MIMSASSTQKKRGFLPGKSGELEEESWRVAWYYEFNYKTTFSPVYDLRSLSATIINKKKEKKEYRDDGDKAGRKLDDDIHFE